MTLDTRRNDAYFVNFKNYIKLARIGGFIMISEKKSYLSFVLEKETFAVNVKKVLEVLQMKKITKIPKTPEFIKGVINFRGEIISVMDARTKFSLQKK